MLYFLVALFLLRDVLPAPSELLPRNSGISEAYEQIGESDQAMVVYLVMRNADTFLRNPLELGGASQCFPFPRAYTLGEHLFNEGILAALPWALTGDAILTYNILLLLTFFLAGFTTSLFAYYLLGDSRAALIAGLLVQLVPGRISDGGHPMLHACYWLPLALLCLHRLFATGRFLPAAGAALFLMMIALETIYIIFGTTILVGVWVCWLIWRDDRYRTRASILCLAAGAAVVAFAILLLFPYLETREIFGVLQGRRTVLTPITFFAPGSWGFPGWVFLLLAALGIVDRWRGARGRRTDDPRLPLFLAVFLLVWIASADLPIPGTPWSLPSPIVLLRGIVPAIDAARGFFAVHVVLYVPLAVLAAFGFRSLGERLPEAPAWVLFGLLAGAIFLGRFEPALADAQFGMAPGMKAHPGRPPDAQIKLVQEHVTGPSVDLPTMGESRRRRFFRIDDLFRLHAFAPRPLAACYNSFDSPYEEQMHQLVSQLPAPAAAEALRALGVETLLMRPFEMSAERTRKFEEELRDSPRARAHVELQAQAGGLRIYRLHARRAVKEEIPLLGAASPGEVAVGTKRPTEVAFRFANRSPFVFRAPGPAGYSGATISWEDEDGVVVTSENESVLLPIALGPGQTMEQSLAVSPPNRPGVFQGWLRVDGHEEPIAGATVRVEAGEFGTALEETTSP